jgi:DNA gyrase inhibitor GyrI
MADAWAKLEASLGSLRGRRFYGVYWKGSYRACAGITEGDDPDEFGFDSWIIPGGLYASAKLKDWAEHTDEIEPVVSALLEANEVDHARPTIEFYRSQRELVLYVPIAESAD